MYIAIFRHIHANKIHAYIHTYTHHGLRCIVADNSGYLCRILEPLLQAGCIHALEEALQLREEEYEHVEYLDGQRHGQSLLLRDSQCVVDELDLLSLSDGRHIWPADISGRVHHTHFFRSEYAVDQVPGEVSLADGVGRTGAVAEVEHGQTLADCLHLPVE